METATNSLVFRPILPSRPSFRRPLVLARYHRQDAGDRSPFHSRMVDENMIVLRMRIQEMKMLETKQEAPDHWMDWEKRWYGSYDADVCEAIGVLQRFLMSSRPSVALGMLMLVGLSVPTAAVVALSHLMVIGGGVLNVIVHH